MWVVDRETSSATVPSKAWNHLLIFAKVVSAISPYSTHSNPANILGKEAIEESEKSDWERDDEDERTGTGAEEEDEEGQPDEERAAKEDKAEVDEGGLQEEEDAEEEEEEGREEEDDDIDAASE